MTLASSLDLALNVYFLVILLTNFVSSLSLVVFLARSGCCTLVRAGRLYLQALLSHSPAVFPTRSPFIRCSIRLLKCSHVQIFFIVLAVKLALLPPEILTLTGCKNDAAFAFTVLASAFLIFAPWCCASAQRHYSGASDGSPFFWRRNLWLHAAHLLVCARCATLLCCALLCNEQLRLLFAHLFAVR